MRPLVTPLNLSLRHWKRGIGATVATIVILLALFPTLLTLSLQYQLPRMGMGRIEIGNIDFNPLTGRLLLEEVGLYRSAAQLFHLQRGEIQLGVFSLLQRRIQLHSIQLQGLSLTIEQGPQGSLKVAGFATPAAPATPPTQVETSTPWDFGIDSFTLRDSELHLLHPAFPESVKLQQISVGAIATWRPEHQTPVVINAGLRDALLTIEGKSSPFAAQPSHSTTLTLARLPLASFAQLVPPPLGGLDGELSCTMALQLSQPTPHRLSLAQQGSVTLTGLGIHYRGSRLAQKQLQWQGKLSLSDIQQLDTLRVEGKLKLNELYLTDETGDAENNLGVHQVTLNGLQLQGLSSLQLEELAIDGMMAAATRKADGIAIKGLPLPPDAEKTAAQEPTPANAPQQEAPPFKLRLAALRMSGENRFSFIDETVKPAYRHRITITDALLQPLDTAEPHQPSTVSLEGRDDAYTRFTVKGEMRPFAPQLSLNLKANLSGLDLPPTSPYLAQLLGYRIVTGQLESDSAMKIEEQVMNGELDLTLNQLQLASEDPARMENFQQKSSLPLNTALSLLRDRDDNIHLKLPISGRLDDPQFDLSDIINTALATSLKAASVGYLKLLLQPYSSLISVVQIAGKAAGHIRLDPITYPPAATAMEASTRAYVAKLAQLLSQKEVNLRLCGYASSADLIALSKGKQKEIPAAGHPQLEALARERAEGIKSLLVTEHGIPAKRLFICHPELDRNDGAAARVELSI